MPDGLSTIAPVQISGHCLRPKALWTRVFVDGNSCEPPASFLWFPKGKYIQSSDGLRKFREAAFYFVLKKVQATFISSQPFLVSLGVYSYQPLQFDALK